MNYGTKLASALCVGVLAIGANIGGAGMAFGSPAIAPRTGGSPSLTTDTPHYTFAGLADYDRDGNQDIIARDQNGLLWLYPGQSTRGFSTLGRFQIGNGWNEYTFAGVADYDRDGNQDIIARDQNGLLWLYPGQSTRGFSILGRFQIGNGWNEYTFAGVADYDRDGNQDIIARDQNGLLWLYPGQSTRGFSTLGRFQIGNGWNGYTFAGVEDYDHDGNQDIVARDPGGLLWLYPGQSTRGFSALGRFQIGNGWEGTTFAGVADYDYDGNQDIVIRTPDGLLWLYPGQSTRGYSTLGRFQIGVGW